MAEYQQEGGGAAPPPKNAADRQMEEEEEKELPVIHFYSPREHPYGCFSNFSDHSIFLAGRRWPTSEHYFQAQKFAHSEHDYNIVAQCRTPGEAASAGRDRSRPLRPDWEDVKDQVMYDAVMAKVLQKKDVCLTLLKTGNAVLVEHTWKDSYWGDGGDGTGKNMLGQVLMAVRAKVAADRVAAAQGGGSTSPPPVETAAPGGGSGGVSATHSTTAGTGSSPVVKKTKPRSRLQ